MKVIKRTGTANTTSFPNRKIEYLVIHYTAGVSCKAGAAESCASWFSRADAGGSADYICDEANLVQYNPDPLNRYCHAVGGSKYYTKGGRLYGIAKNSNCVSLEICSGNTKGKITYPNDPAYYFSTVVLAKAIESAQYLMDLYHIDSDHVIRHYDVNGKQCPGVIGWNKDSGSENAWESFHLSLETSPVPIYRVRMSWDKPDTQIDAFFDLGNAKACADAHPHFSVYDENGKVIYTAEPSKTPSDGSFTPEQWIALLAPDAQEIAENNGILASVIIAQGSLETGWGKTDLAKRHNIFGMKADLINNTWKEWSTWDGTTYYKFSPEEENGEVVQRKSAFRVYKSYRECMEDYVGFLLHVRNNKGLKYARIKGVKDPAEVIHIIRIGTGTNAHPEGYATDSGYEKKIMNLIKKYNLTQYDNHGDSEPIRKTVYRVQVEADEKFESTVKTVKEIKDCTDFECFVEKATDGLWHVYCGSFENKENARLRRKQILDIFDDKYKGTFIVEKIV